MSENNHNNHIFDLDVFLKKNRPEPPPSPRHAKDFQYPKRTFADKMATRLSKKSLGIALLVSSLAASVPFFMHWNNTRNDTLAYEAISELLLAGDQSVVDQYDSEIEEWIEESDINSQN